MTTSQPVFLVTAWLGVYCGNSVLGAYATRELASRGADSYHQIREFASAGDAIAEFPRDEKLILRALV
jgi:hypothetical protein